MSEKMIILFDEYGTPTLREDRENKFFVGVALSYNVLNETMIFNQMKDLSGLENQNPLKNNKITTKRAIAIANKLKQLPAFIVTVFIDLSNKDFIETIRVYYPLSNKIREVERNIKGRKIAQFIHSKVLERCLFDSITLCCEHINATKSFNIFIDAWSIPREDIYIYLNYRADSLSRRIGKLFPDIAVSPIQLLKDDTKQKRLVDSVVSVVSRKYYPPSNTKYSKVPFDILFNNGLSSSVSVDITKYITSFMIKMLSLMNKG